MNIASVAVNTTINYLKSIQDLSDRVIVPEYDSSISPIAISEPIMSVGVESFHAGESLYTKNSDGETVPRNERDYKLKMRIRIYTSFANGAQRTYTAADYIYSVLLRSAFDYKISEIIFDDAEYDSQTESIRLTTHFTVEGTF